MTPRRRAAGFTLLEVIVAVALFSLLLASLQIGFTTAVRAYETAERRVGDGARLRVLSAFLRRSLAQTQPLALADRSGWQLLFDGRAQRIRYVTELPGHLGFGGLYEVVLDVRDDARGLRLVMQRRPFLVDRRSGELLGDFHERDLLDGIGALSLRYLGAREPDGPRRWHDDWPAARRLPELIEVQIADADGREWPPLHVRPFVDTVRYQAAGNVELPGSGATSSRSSLGSSPTTATGVRQ